MFGMGGVKGGVGIIEDSISKILFFLNSNL